MCQEADDQTDSLEAKEFGRRGVQGFFKGCVNTNVKQTAYGWDIDPDGLLATARELEQRYHLPLLITENGMGAEDQLVDGKIQDVYRIDYLREHIQAMQKAMEDGCQFLGYCPWSAIDVVSTTKGIRKRYGFVYVNRTDDELLDLRRIPKESYYWYQKVIKSNGTVIK